ncbi:hypothetical protein [Paenibacillus xylanexedens]|uniref:hypothetical protein n=1 Tax=Paenibacillus xylanexedens TaxID=528191 RepID=UPI0028E5E3AC|nr:hypothetical protein [Paenibacillus xylanexedens]
MIIEYIVIYDYINGRINKFDFDSKTNILISDGNIVGKSSLMKSVYYNLGYSIKVWPENWCIDNMMFQLMVRNEEAKHSITRHKNLFYIDGNQEVLNEKEYSMWLQNFLNISIKIKKKKPKELSDVYSSEVLLPFYIDQDKSWSGYLFSKSSDSFGRYNSCVKDIFDIYFGISNNEILELEIEKSERKSELTTLIQKLEVIKKLGEDYPELKEPLKTEKFGLSEGSVNEYLNRINILTSSTMEINNKLLDNDIMIDELKIENLELEKMKKKYEKNIKDINHTCTLCNSKLTIEQSVRRFKIRNNLYEIVYIIEENKKKLIQFEEKRTALRSTKEEILAEQKYYEEQSKNYKLFTDIESYIEEQATQKSALSYLKMEGDIIKRKFSIDEVISGISKDIAKKKREIKKKRDAINQKYLYLINEYERYFKDIKLSDSKFYDFKEVTGSGIYGNKILLALYTLYANLINEFSNYKLPFAMDSFIKNEIAAEQGKQMFAFLEEYYLTLQSQTFFSIIEDNKKYLVKENYHFINLSKPILNELNAQNENLLNFFENVK